MADISGSDAPRTNRWSVINQVLSRPQARPSVTWVRAGGKRRGGRGWRGLPIDSGFQLPELVLSDGSGLESLVNRAECCVTVGVAVTHYVLQEGPELAGLGRRRVRHVYTMDPNRVDVNRSLRSG